MKKQILLSVILSLLFIASCSKDNVDGGNNIGTGGSMARFTIAPNSHLYIVDGSQLHTFGLADQSRPLKLSTVDIGFEIETIYAWRQLLFIGSQNAMYIYSIQQPSQPVILGMAEHVRACDPVIANDSLAYVTVRSGTGCGGNTNALFVYDITKTNQPTHISQINLVNPHGLGLQKESLFVCDGRNGLIVFDLSLHAAYPQQKKHITGYTFLDCIPMGDVLICMVEGGIALYDIKDINNMTLLSEILN